MDLSAAPSTPMSSAPAPAPAPASFRSRARRWLRRLVWGIPAWLIAAYLGVSLFSAERLTRTHNRAELLDPRVVSDRATAWSVRTDDGLTLRGWYHSTPEKRHLVVLVHGLWSSWRQMAELGRDLHERGYDVLLFDLRGHGRSDPSRVTMGRRERNDLRAVLAWARREGFPPERIGWIGHSMGGSTLLMEAARNPNIRVAVIDSPYGDLPVILDRELSRHSHLPRFFNPGILTAARLAFGVRTDDLVPIRAAQSWGNRPLLLIHGEADTTVPVRQAYQIAAAAGPSCQAVWLPGVEHVRGYRSDPEQYVATVDSFLTRNLTR
jgi:alpha-beta hydrolase superfamily lysophospholipase